jgi:hypothetical protein
LRLSSDEANTITFSTVTDLSVVSDMSTRQHMKKSDLPVSVDIIVECDFLAFQHIPLRKYSHS